jgi:hypothetical protein
VTTEPVDPEAAAQLLEYLFGGEFDKECEDATPGTD